MTATAPLDRKTGTSLHHQVFLLLRDEIARGRYASTGALPREEDVCSRFQVSRATVRRALSDLANLGVVERKHGLGTFIRAGSGQARSGPSLTLLNGLLKTVAETDVEVVYFAKEEPPREVLQLLELAPGTKTVHATRLRSMHGIPVLVTDAWIPLDFAKGVTAAALRKRALYEILVSSGMALGRVVQETSAHIAHGDIANLLDIDSGAPELRMVRVMHDAAGRPVLYLAIHCAAERSRILTETSADQVNSLIAGNLVHDVAPPAVEGMSGRKGRRR